MAVDLTVQLLESGDQASLTRCMKPGNRIGMAYSSVHIAKPDPESTVCTYSGELGIPITPRRNECILCGYQDQLRHRVRGTKNLEGKCVLLPDGPSDDYPDEKSITLHQSVEAAALLEKTLMCFGDAILIEADKVIEQRNAALVSSQE